MPQILEVPRKFDSFIVKLTFFYVYAMHNNQKCFKVTWNKVICSIIPSKSLENEEQKLIYISILLCTRFTQSKQQVSWQSLINVTIYVKIKYFLETLPVMIVNMLL